MCEASKMFSLSIFDVVAVVVIVVSFNCLVCVEFVPAGSSVSAVVLL